MKCLEDDLVAIDEETPILAPRPSAAKNGGAKDSITVGGSFVSDSTKRPSSNNTNATSSTLSTFAQAIPATLLATALNLLLSVPFGSAYFSSVIPLEEGERESMGIRLSLLALCVGQLVMGGGTSAFDPVTVWQLGELSPFYHTLANIAARLAHDESEIFPTTLYLLSMSTLVCGAMFFVLGKCGLGQLTYFFPSHVLLGLVGGIGVWLVILSTSISISPSCAPAGPEFFAAGTNHFALSLAFAVLLRVLRRIFPKEKFMLLDPFFFLSIPLVFYLGLHVFGISIEYAVSAGYLFADPDSSSAYVEKDVSPWAETGKLWTDFSFAKVHWNAVFPAASTLLTAGLMGVMIAAPFIPAMASLFEDTDQVFDFNREFLSHGLEDIPTR